MPQAQNIKNKPAASKVTVQPKLEINLPGDRYEQEADAMADRVMRTVSAVSPPNEGGKPYAGQGMIGKSVQMMRPPGNDNSGVAGLPAPSSVVSALNQSAGGGFPLPSGTRSFMENAFSTNFSRVRLHADAQSAEMNKQIQAKAFAYGNDIYFNKGQFNPGSPEGKWLLSHELTHVLQQQEGGLAIHRFEARVHESVELNGLTTAAPGSAALTQEESLEIYFGNWMRDMNQVFVPMVAELGIPNDVLFGAISYLAAKKFGRVLTPEQFGFYIPSEHIDNPGGLVAQDDLLPAQPTVNAPAVVGAVPRPADFTTQQESIDPATATVLGANIFSVDQTGTMAYIRRSNLQVERRLDLAVRAGRTPEGFMHLGAGLHAIEDLFAHSNFIEIAVGRLLSTDSSILPSLTGADRRVFTYSPTINVGHVSDAGPANRPVLTTGTFTGADTQVSISSELIGLLNRPLPAPTTNAEGRAEERFISTLLRSFQNTLSQNSSFRAGMRDLLTRYGLPGFAADAVLSLPLEQMYYVTTILPAIIPDSVRIPIQTFIRDFLSRQILQPLGHELQAHVLDSTIADTSLIQNLRDNQRAQVSSQPTAAQLETMRVRERFTGRPVQQQQQDAMAVAARRVQALQHTPEAVVAGPSHSQIAKDHPNSPFFGLAFSLATIAVGRIRDHVIAAWNERAGSPTTPFNFDFTNFPQVPASPPADHGAAEDARSLYHETRTRHATESGESQTRGAAILRQGGAGAPYDLAAMRHDSADQLRAVASSFRSLANSPAQVAGAIDPVSRLLGTIPGEESTRIRQELAQAASAARTASRSTTADELRTLSDELDITAGLVETASTFAQRATVHSTLITQRTEAIARLSGLSIGDGTAVPIIIVINDQIANTAPAYLAEQAVTLAGGHQTGLTSPAALTLSTVRLPDPATDFANVARSPQHRALIAEARLLMNHPYENNWWEAPVRQYIGAHGPQILADIEARNQGVATFRRPGQRPDGH